jgi:acyl carrier protein
MTISSRTPEGDPNRCPICGAEVCIEPSPATGDAPCPRCGHLLWWLRARAAQRFRVDPHRISAQTSFVDDLAADSLDVVELVMELEDEFDITIPDEDYERIRTVGDAIAYVESRM